MKKRPKVPVRIEYSDGTYTMYRWEGANLYPNLPFLEIDARDWEDYRKHTAQEVIWHKYLRDLDNKLFALEHPEKQS